MLALRWQTSNLFPGGEVVHDGRTERDIAFIAEADAVGYHRARTDP